MISRSLLARAATAVALAAAVAPAISGCGTSDRGSGFLYVSPAGSDRNPGTREMPFLSLGKAYAAADPGDVVKVAAGRYSAQQVLEYEGNKTDAAEPVTFIARGRAHFQAALPNPSHWTDIGASHLTFEGEFEFDYVNLREDTHGMSEVVFRRAWIHHLTESGNLDGLGLYENRMGPNDVWPSTGSRQTDATGPDDILNFGVGKRCAPAACFAYSATGVRVVGNRFDGAYNSWDGSHSDCIQYTVGQSGYIADNTFANCQNETLILQGSIGPLAGITIENNALGRPIEESDPFAIHISPCSRCVIRFNSVPSRGSLFYAAAALDEGSSPPGEEVYGNIAGYYDPEQCAASEAAGWSWEYNLFTGSGGTCGERGVESAESGAAAVDLYRGSAPVSATDIKGVRRPQGPYPDAGAFESRVR